MGLFVAANQILCRLNHKIVRELEAHNRLRGNLDIPIPRQSAQRRSATSSDQSANQQSDAASGYTTHKHSKPRAAADKRGRPLPLTLLGLRQVTRIECISRAVQREIGQPQFQNRAALEVPSPMRLDYHTAHRRALWNHNAIALPNHRIDDLSIKPVSRMARLYADVLVDPNR